jgi:signal transduction histidine kinase
MSTGSRVLDRYVALVTATGCALVLWFSASAQLRVASQTQGFWMFALLLFLGEIFPISVPGRHGEVDEVTASTTFAFALLIGFGTAPAVAVQVIASLIADAMLRKATWKMAFNVGQYGLSLGAAGAAYHWMGGTVGDANMAAFVVSALVFFLLNTALTDVVLAHLEGQGFWPFLRRDLVFQSYATLPLLALAPVAVSAADDHVWLVPLVAAPAVAVWWGTRLALDNARLATELRGSLDDQRELNRLKDDFVSVVSHELRTPLTSIQGYVKTLLQLSSDLPEDERRAFLEAADRQGDRLRRLIEQLLIVGRLDSHVEPLTLCWVDVGELVGSVVEELGPRARGHAFHVRIAPGLGRVETDDGKLHQIVSNLVENALKYAPPDTRVTIQVDPTDEGVTLVVADEGPGIPAEAHERIFERFYQVDQSATRRVGGTGLGLYICRRMAETLGARLWLARSDDAGSAFALWIPMQVSGAGTGARNEDQSITARV